MTNKCKDYAVRQRLDHAHKKNPDDMDVNDVENEEECIDAIGKGGKGKDGKGKGKGKDAVCFRCGHRGHRVAYCKVQNIFNGYCLNCGQWGHNAMNCKVEKGKGKGKGKDGKGWFKGKGLGKANSVEDGGEYATRNEEDNESVGGESALNLGGEVSSLEEHFQQSGWKVVVARIYLCPCFS